MNKISRLAKKQRVMWGMAVSLAASVFVVVLLAPAQDPVRAQSSSGFQNPLRFNSLDQFLTALLDVIIRIGFPIVVLAVIWSGFLFVKARGNKDDLIKAKEAITWTLVGALLVLGAFVLSTLIKATVDDIT